MSIVIPNPACAEQCTTTTSTSSEIIWLEVVVPGAWKGISWAGGSESIIAVQGDAGTGSPWISIDSGASWADQAGAFPAPLPLTSVACSDPAVSAGGPDATAVVTASASSVVHRTTNSGTNWNTQVIAGPNSYGCSAITADGTHVIVGRGDGLEYTNDAFDAAGAWVTSGAGGSAMTVAGVSPIKSESTEDADGCGCSSDTATDGYKVYYGYDPATPFVVSGPAFVWNTGVPTIVGSGSPSLNWTAITLSENGRFALATATGEKIRTASNWGAPGAQWGTLVNSPAKDWVGIAARRNAPSTSDFGTIAAVERCGGIWMSFDNGVTWQEMPGTFKRNWSSIDSNEDGTRFVATVDEGNIWTYPFTSTTTTTTTTGGPVPPRLWSRAQPDCIATTTTPVPAVYANCCDGSVGYWVDRCYSEIWSCVASDTTGDKLVAGVDGGDIFLSDDCGITWTAVNKNPTPPVPSSWVSVASNATGQTLAALTVGGEIWVSTNRGTTWTLSETINGGTPSVAITMNGTGNVIAAVSYDAGTDKDTLSTTTTTGAVWVNLDTIPGNIWTSISSNLIGDQLILSMSGTAANPTDGNVFLAVPIAPVPQYSVGAALSAGTRPWSSVASNADGNVLVATDGAVGGLIYVSTDGGTTWSSGGSHVSTVKWSSVASNYVGDLLVAISEQDFIWSSSNYGLTWTNFNPPAAATVVTNGTQKCISSNSVGNKLVAVFNTTPGTAGEVWTYCGGDVIISPATIVVEAGPVTQRDLNMRRKAEILQYKKNNSNMSKKQLWARTIKGHGPSGNRTWATQSADGTYTNPNIDNLKPSGAFTLRCPGRPNNCAPTSNSDVPGKQMILCMRPDVPLTNYIVNRTYLAGGTKWPQTAWKPGDNGFPVGKAGRNLVFK
jgi:hypothetical protein